MTHFLRKALFRVRRHYRVLALSAVRVAYWRLLGMQIGDGTKLSHMVVTWPHRVRLGRRCSLEQGVFFNGSAGYVDGVGVEIGDGTFIGNGCEFNVTSKVTVGQNCLIAAGCRFIDHNHGMALDRPMIEQPETHAAITVGSNVWLGVHCVVLKGVTIGDGAIVAAGSVVRGSVAANTIVGGVPAKLIRARGDAGAGGAAWAAKGDEAAQQDVTPQQKERRSIDGVGMAGGLEERRSM